MSESMGNGVCVKVLDPEENRRRTFFLYLDIFSFSFSSHLIFERRNKIDRELEREERERWERIEMKRWRDELLSFAITLRVLIAWDMFTTTCTNTCSFSVHV